MLCPGMCQYKQGRLWAGSLGGGTCRAVLQEVILGCSRTGIALSQLEDQGKVTMSLASLQEDLENRSKHR